MKREKDGILNVEKFHKKNTCLDVTTRKDRFNQIYYVLHVAIKKKDGLWNNQYLLINDENLANLCLLARKSMFFAATIPNTDFIAASDLLKKPYMNRICSYG